MTRTDTLRLLHTSDVHIGAFTERWSPEPGRCLLAFRSLVDRALQEGVDLVVIAGDFFDHNRVRQPVSDFVVSELARLPMPTVILPGNHDPLERDSVYWRMDLGERAPRVRLIQRPEGETVRIPELGVALWGKPHVSYEDVSLTPLKEIPPRGIEPWQIAVAHGHFVRTPEDRGRAYPITPDDIAAADRDYVALGHWDAHMAVSQGQVTAYYPGSPTWVGLSAIVEMSGTNGRRQVSVTPLQIRR